MSRVFLENVSKVFDKQVTAVSDFKLEVADSEFMVIVGPSGSGKTTILRMLAGLEHPNSGNIYIGDKLVNNIPPKNRNVAMVFQNYALYPHMNVYENIAFALKMRKSPKKEIDKRVKNVSGLLCIEHLLSRKPHALSGGQCQRVALARAIVRSPKVFLFDEPLSNLDVALRTAMRSELKAIHNKLKITTIYVTHDQSEAMTLGDRICVIYNGIIEQLGSPIDIYERPENKFVAGFFGSPSMNFFTGRIKFINDTPYFVIGNDTVTLPPRLKNLISGYADTEMVMGIRPENLSLSPFSSQPCNAVDASVDLIEPLGNHTNIYLTAGHGNKFVIDTSPHIKLNVRESAKIYIDYEKLNLFTPGRTGKNITLSHNP